MRSICFEQPSFARGEGKIRAATLTTVLKPLMRSEPDQKHETRNARLRVLELTISSLTSDLVGFVACQSRLPNFDRQSVSTKFTNDDFRVVRSWHGGNAWSCLLDTVYHATTYVWLCKQRYEEDFLRSASS